MQHYCAENEIYVGRGLSDHVDVAFPDNYRGGGGGVARSPHTPDRRPATDARGGGVLRDVG